MHVSNHSHVMHVFGIVGIPTGRHVTMNICITLKSLFSMHVLSGRNSPNTTFPLEKITGI